MISYGPPNTKNIATETKALYSSFLRLDQKVEESHKMLDIVSPELIVSVFEIQKCMLLKPQ